MQSKEDDGSKIFVYGPLRGRPDMWYDHVPRCQDDPNCFRSACGYCHPERDSRNTRWTWVYPAERVQPNTPQFSQPQHFISSPPSQSYPKEIKSKSEVPCNLDFIDTSPRPYNPWAFNSTELRKDFGSFSLFQRPHARFSSALKIESPKNEEKQGPFDQVQDKLDDKVHDTAIDDKVVQEIEKLVNDAPEVQPEVVNTEVVNTEVVNTEVVHAEVVQDEAVREKPKDESVQELQNDSSEQEAVQVKQMPSPNEAIPAVPTPASSNPEASSKVAAVFTTARTALEPKTASFSDTRKGFHLKSKSFQKEPLSFASETTKQLRIRKLAGHDQRRAQFSLKGGSSDSKLSKSTPSLQLEKTNRLDAMKKESSSQLLDTDASPPIEGWWEMFILFWFTCGKKMRILIVALCALFAVVFSSVVPKKRTRDTPSGASKVSVPSPSLPATAK